MSAQWDLSNQQLTFVLHVLGLWPKITYKFDLYTLYSGIMFICFIALPNMIHVIDIFYVDKLGEVAAIFFILIPAIGILSKIYVILTNMKTVKGLMNNVNKQVFLPKNQLQKLQGDLSLKLWKRLVLVYFVLGSITLSLWIFLPILNGTYKNYVLPFLAWYPFDPKRPVVYEIAYIHQSLSVIYFSTINLNIDTLVYGFIMFTGIQCDILCDNLRKLHEKDNISEGFRECIKQHKEILKFTKYLNKTFGFLIFVQFFVSSVSLAFTMFRLSMGEVLTSQFASDASYEIALTMQIIMFTGIGNEVLFKSSNISTAVYEFDWTNQPEQFKKDIVFFIQRAQKPIVFTAYGLFDLSLETFMRIMRTAWSYFAVLHNFS